MHVQIVFKLGTFKCYKNETVLYLNAYICFEFISENHICHYLECWVTIFNTCA